MTAKNAKLAALRLLGIKNRTVLELKKKLKLRGFSSEEVDRAVEACRTYGYLNDEEEAQRRVEQLKRKGYGPQLIAAKFQHQGLIPPKISFDDQMIAIRHLMTKSAWKKKEKKRLIAALKRRGFDFEAIFALLNSTAKKTA